MRKTYIAFIIIFLSFVYSISLNVQGIYAASTIISVSPQSGSYDKPFNVDLVIDGHGDSFNAAKATVAVSSNLSVNNLVLGDCGFSYVNTPSIANPSFSGVLLGGSSKKCTVYTLTLNPTAKGNASVSLSNASVKRYGDAAEILSSVQNGTYTISSVSTTQAVQPTIPQSQNDLYTVVLKVFSNDSKPVNNAAVTLTTVAGNVSLKAISDNTGTAYFTNVKPGIYSAVAQTKQNQEAKNIVNVAGSNHTLVLGIKVQEKNPSIKLQSFQNNPIFVTGVLIIGIILGIIIALFLILFKRRVKLNKFPQ